MSFKDVIDNDPVIQKAFKELSNMNSNNEEIEDLEDNPMSIVIKPEVLDISMLGDDSDDNNLWRPNLFKEYIGQENLKDIIQARITGCKKRNQVFPHMLIDGSAGCFKENTKILMADYSTKNIQDIKEGDLVLGFDEYPEKKYTRRYLKPSIVTNLYKRESKGLVYLKSDKNSVWTTNEHPFLTYLTGKKQNKFIEAKDLFAQHSFLNFSITDINNDYRLGWLLGVILSDGSIVKEKIHFYNQNKQILKRYKKYIKTLYSLNLKTIIKENNVGQISFSSKLISNHLLKIYKNILKNNNYSKDIFRGIIGGFFDGDGTVIKKNNNPQHIILLNTDKQLIKFLTIISKKLKFKIKIYKKNIKKREIGNSGYFSKKRIMYNLHLYDLQKFYCECKPVSKIFYSQINGTQGLQKLLIKKIFRKQDFKNNKLDFTVYNLTTTTSTYIANGFPVHNCGKTTIAYLTSKYLNVPFIECTAGTIESPQQFVDKLALVKGGIFFIDELQEIKSKIANFILPILEDFQINGKKIKKFTLFACTTEKGKLIKKFKPLVERMKIQNTLENYTTDELIKIIKQFKEKSFSEENIHDDVYKLIANNCRNTPRMGLRVLENYIFMGKTIQETLKAEGIIKEGLTIEDIKVLQLLSEQKNGVGVKAIASYLGTSEENYLYKHEQYLLGKKLITITSRRIITEKGRLFLKNI